MCYYIFYINQCNKILIERLCYCGCISYRRGRVYGSHTVLELIEKNEEVIVVDNLEKGHKKAVLGGKLIVGDLRDMDFIRSVF